jgi:hypothetical protein
MDIKKGILLKKIGIGLTGFQNISPLLDILLLYQ